MGVLDAKALRSQNLMQHEFLQGFVFMFQNDLTLFAQEEFDTFKVPKKVVVPP